MSAVRGVGSRPSEEWQNLSKEGVFSAPLVQTEDTRWGRVRFEDCAQRVVRGAR